MNAQTEWKPDKPFTCTVCGLWFQIETGQWSNGIFEFTCPQCKTKLGTQTMWFELRPLDTIKSQIQGSTND